jgi:lipopolysaccharide/colanic/teichoic acid biosynthesis glycosyltransferase
MYKFRTMLADADRTGPAVTGASDPRVTPVGRVLRATKIDELPQLLNVLRGDMSLVGPRPESPRYVALYDQRQREVLSVLPGITGPTQLRYRHEERILTGEDVERQYCALLMPVKLESDLEYVRTRTAVGDFRVLVATFGALFERAGK